MSATVLSEVSLESGTKATLNEELEDEEAFKEVDDLFNKNTESFRCLTQIFISRSSLLREALYHFPPLEDPGIDKAFYDVESGIVPDNTGREYYLKLCKDFNIPPSRRVLKSLSEKVLNLKYYGLREKAIRAITSTLLLNEHVEVLILEDNFLTPDDCQRIGDLLSKSKMLRCLNLKQCNIRAEGAEALAEGIGVSTTLTELDLSYNNLGDRGLLNLEDAIAYHTSLKKINLCRNQLAEESAFTLSRIFDVNNKIADVDLSWNELNTERGNKAFFKRLEDNLTITVFNFAWNGIGTTQNTIPLIKYLRTAETLEHLDISSNCITGVVFTTLRRALVKCTSLVSLRLGGNPLRPNEAFSAARLLNVLTRLRFVDLENAFVNKDFLPFWKNQTARGKSIMIEGILNNYVIRGPDFKKVLFNRANYVAAKTKRKNFGHFILQMPECDLSKQEFATEARKFKAKKLDKDLLLAIGGAFPAKKQKVNLKKLKESYLSYFPNTSLPPKKKKGKKKGKETQLKETSDAVVTTTLLAPTQYLSPYAETSEKDEEESETGDKEEAMEYKEVEMPIPTEAIPSQTRTLVTTETQSKPFQAAESEATQTEGETPIITEEQRDPTAALAN